jgi:hypothetical protein
MPISEGSRMLLEEAVKQVHSEGYHVLGCYMAQDPQNIELVHFTAPQMSRSALTQMLKCWLDIVEDHSITAERVEPDEKPRIYQA